MPPNTSLPLRALLVPLPNMPHTSGLPTPYLKLHKNCQLIIDINLIYSQNYSL